MNEVLKGHRESVICVETSPDCPHILASGSEDGTVRLWDLRTRKSVRRIGAFDGECVSDSADEINHIAVNEDGSCLAAGDDSGAVHLYNVEASGMLEHSAVLDELHSNLCTTVCFLGNRVVSGGLDAAVHCIDVGSPVEAARVEFRTPAQPQVTNPPLVHHLARCPHDGLLAAALGDCTVAILEPFGASVRLWAMLEGGHTSSVSQVRWLTKGCLISGANDSKLVLWSLHSGEAPRIFNHGSKINWLAVSTAYPGLAVVADQTSQLTIRSLI